MKTPTVLALVASAALSALAAQARSIAPTGLPSSSSVAAPAPPTARLSAKGGQITAAAKSQQPPTNPVPEPTTVAICVGGAFLLLLVFRSQK